MEQKQSYNPEEVAQIAKHFDRVAINKYRLCMCTGSGDAQMVSPDLLDRIGTYKKEVP